MSKYQIYEIFSICLRNSCHVTVAAKLQEVSIITTRQGPPALTWVRYSHDCVTQFCGASLSGSTTILHPTPVLLCTTRPPRFGSRVWIIVIREIDGYPESV